MKHIASSRAFRFAGYAFIGLSLMAGNAWALPNASDVIPANGGSIRITPIFHGSLCIEYRGKVIQVDPFSAGDYSGAKKADIVLITDIHSDHLDEKAISQVLRNKGSRSIYCPPAVAAKLQPPLSKLTVPFSFVRKSGTGFWNVLFGDVEINIFPIPMYNLKRGPKAGEKFHPKGRGYGYIVMMGGKRIYIAGDTEVTPEMTALKDIDVAFIPMNLPYTMTPQEAAAGVKAFKPKIVYPYHYRYPFDKANNNPQTFAAALKGTNISVRLRDWYGHPAKGAN